MTQVPNPLQAALANRAENDGVDASAADKAVAEAAKIQAKPKPAKEVKSGYYSRARFIFADGSSVYPVEGRLVIAESASPAQIAELDAAVAAGSLRKV